MTKCTFSPPCNNEVTDPDKTMCESCYDKILEAYEKVTTCVECGKVLVANAYGIKMGDVTNASTLNYMLELGATPYLRLLGPTGSGAGGWTAAR